MSDGRERLKEEARILAREAREKTIGYILGGVGLVVGIAWNDAVRALIDYSFRLEKNSITAKFIYAAILTIVFVIVTTYLMRLIKKNQEEQKK